MPDATPTMEVLPEKEAAPPDHTAGIEPRAEMHVVGMICFLFSEVAFFSTLIMCYVIFLRHGDGGPTPREVLSMPLVILNTIFLLSSSFTIHMAEKALHGGRKGAFHLLWGLTIALGVAFLAGTGIEWYDMITTHGLTISTNLFGTTYYTLVGFHAFHVSMGVLALTSILCISLAGKFVSNAPVPVKLVGWYWHFVDVVWIAVFLVVYVFGR